MGSNRKTALITGASGGIGLELSKLFAADGYNLVLVARSGQKLQDIAADLRKAHSVEVTVLAKDLSAASAPDEILATLQAQSILVDVLVNNAGFGVHGLFAETDLSQELNMLQLNVVTVTHLTKLLLPGMIERGFGRILNIGSTGSFQPVPLMAAYGASKAYVLLFTEALAEELRGTGVTATALCPGVTRTGFQARADVGQTLLVRIGTMSAERVAAIGYGALMRGQAVVVPGLLNKVLAFFVRLMPRALVARVARGTMEPVGG